LLQQLGEIRDIAAVPLADKKTTHPRGPRPSGISERIVTNHHGLRRH
jgi:hypothetical protein